MKLAWLNRNWQLVLQARQWCDVARTSASEVISLKYLMNLIYNSSDMTER